MRGTDPAHHIHVTEKGEPGFVGLAYYAPSLDDLKRLAKTPGASAVEAIDEPGGGKRVRCASRTATRSRWSTGSSSTRPFP
jgi:hypothetical protein